MIEYTEINQSYLDKMTDVIAAARIYRKHMLGEIEPVGACGVNLDEAIAKLDQIQ